MLKNGGNTEVFKHLGQVKPGQGQVLKRFPLTIDTQLSIGVISS
jgi:hypothetical protein